MARRQAKQHNKLRIHDNLSDCDITLYYRMPTTKERQEYQNMAIRRKNNTVVMDQAAARLTSGMKILEGFEPGDFERIDDAGNYVPLASHPDAPGYYPGWKNFVEDNAADLVMLLAAHVFDASASLIQGAEDIEGK